MFGVYIYICIYMLECLLGFFFCFMPSRLVSNLPILYILDRKVRLHGVKKTEVIHPCVELTSGVFACCCRGLTGSGMVVP